MLVFYFMMFLGRKEVEETYPPTTEDILEKSGNFLVIFQEGCAHV